MNRRYFGKILAGALAPLALARKAVFGSPDCDCDQPTIGKVTITAGLPEHCDYRDRLRFPPTYYHWNADGGLHSVAKHPNPRSFPLTNDPGATEDGFLMYGKFYDLATDEEVSHITYCDTTGWVERFDLRDGQPFMGPAGDRLVRIVERRQFKLVFHNGYEVKSTDLRLDKMHMVWDREYSGELRKIWQPCAFVDIMPGDVVRVGESQPPISPHQLRDHHLNVLDHLVALESGGFHHLLTEEVAWQRSGGELHLEDLWRQES